MLIFAVAPFQDLARTFANDFDSNVFLYLNVHRSNSTGMATFGQDYTAIMGKMQGGQKDEQFTANIQVRHYNHIKT